MFSYIERLRKKPLKERRRIAISVAVIVVAILAVLWLALKLSDPRVSETKQAGRDDSQAYPSGIIGPYE